MRTLVSATMGRFEVQQMVVILVDRAGSVFSIGITAACTFFSLRAAEHVFKPLAGQHFDAGAEQFPGRLFAKCAALPLKCRLCSCAASLVVILARRPSHRRASWLGQAQQIQHAVDAVVHHIHHVSGW